MWIPWCSYPLVYPYIQIETVLSLGETCLSLLWMGWMMEEILHQLVVYPVISRYHEIIYSVS